MFIFDYLFGTFIILYLMKKNQKFSLDYLLEIFIYIAFVQSIFVLIMFVSEGFRTFIFSISEETKGVLYERSGGFRGLGIASASCFDFPIFQSFGLMFIAFLTHKIKDIKKIFIYSFMFIFILISVLISGRIGWVGISLAILIFALNYLKFRENFRNNFLIVVALIIFFMLCIFIFNNIINNDLKLIIRNKIIPFSMEMFINKIEKGQFSAHSLDILLAEHYFQIKNKL
jgi:hypothetical protein